MLPGGILKVGSFLNHQLDPQLFHEMALEFHKAFGDLAVTKILTIEASGIGIASITGLVFGCKVLFAKKSRTANLSGEFYTQEVTSYTHGNSRQIIVERQFLNADDRVLVIDDFLANGAATDGLIGICSQAKAHVVGVGIAIEKAFQPGGESLRKRGIKLLSLARIESMDAEKGIVFCKD